MNTKVARKNVVKLPKTPLKQTYYTGKESSLLATNINSSNNAVVDVRSFIFNEAKNSTVINVSELERIRDWSTAYSGDDTLMSEERKVCTL